jgi:hypothetical protein
MRHQSQTDEDEARDCWIQRTADQLYLDWKNELLHGEKIIIALGYEQADIVKIADLNNELCGDAYATTLSIRRRQTPDQALRELAFDYVVDNENDFLQRDIGWD